MLFSSSLLFLISSGWSWASENLTVAVAANFAPAMEELTAQFAKETGGSVQMTVSSTGRLYAQIRNGAPFDLFFAADTKRPNLLYQEGRCEQPMEYVRGRVVLWSRDNRVCAEHDTWQQVVAGQDLKRIGMANPELAPYGDVVRKVLVAGQLMDKVESRLVFAANVSQSFQYAATGATGGSFIALSLARTPIGEKGCTIQVPEAELVSQGVCLVIAPVMKKAAGEFLSFVQSDRAKAVLDRFGYQLP